MAKCLPCGREFEVMEKRRCAFVACDEYLCGCPSNPAFSVVTMRQLGCQLDNYEDDDNFCTAHFQTAMGILQRKQARKKAKAGPANPRSVSAAKRQKVCEENDDDGDYGLLDEEADQGDEDEEADQGDDPMEIFVSRHPEGKVNQNGYPLFGRHDRHKNVWMCAVGGEMATSMAWHCNGEETQQGGTGHECP